MRFGDALLQDSIVTARAVSRNGKQNLRN
jgi:hypothetical protein